MRNPARARYSRAQACRPSRLSLASKSRSWRHRLAYCARFSGSGDTPSCPDAGRVAGAAHNSAPPRPLTYRLYPARTAPASHLRAIEASRCRFNVATTTRSSDILVSARATSVGLVLTSPFYGVRWLDTAFPKLNRASHPSRAKPGHALDLTTRSVRFSRHSRLRQICFPLLPSVIAFRSCLSPLPFVEAGRCDQHRSGSLRFCFCFCFLILTCPASF
jgi:hypothetical protein